MLLFGSDSVVITVLTPEAPNPAFEEYVSAGAPVPSVTTAKRTSSAKWCSAIAAPPPNVAVMISTFVSSSLVTVIESEATPIAVAVIRTAFSLAKAVTPISAPTSSTTVCAEILIAAARAID